MMKITKLVTHWEASEADAVIAFLDELSDLLWTVYGEQIIEMRCTETNLSSTDDNQLEFKFDDEIDF